MKRELTLMLRRIFQSKASMRRRYSLCFSTCVRQTSVRVTRSTRRSRRYTPPSFTWSRRSTQAVLQGAIAEYWLSYILSSEQQLKSKQRNVQRYLIVSNVILLCSLAEAIHATNKIIRNEDMAHFSGPNWSKINIQKIGFHFGWLPAFTVSP